MAAYRSTSEPRQPPAAPRPAQGGLGFAVAPGNGAIIPASSIAGNALMIVVAIMSFLACLTVGAVALVRDSARDWQQDIGREVTIQVKPVEGVDTAGEVAKAVNLARATAGVRSAEALDDRQNLALLEPWLGAGLDAAELPIPRLIVVSISDPDNVDLAGLSRRLANDVRGAVLDDHRMWTERLRAMANATVIGGFSILALVFVATVLSVVFATRGAMAGNRDIVSVLHFVGAEDGFIAGEFQRHFLLLGLRGGLAGAIAAAILFALLSFVLSRAIVSPEAAQVAALFGRFAVGPTGYLGALAVAFVIAVLTAVTSRLTVYRYLAVVE
jgi:cell division transport system permease protein